MQDRQWESEGIPPTVAKHTYTHAHACTHTCAHAHTRTHTLEVHIGTQLTTLINKRKLAFAHLNYFL